VGNVVLDAAVPETAGSSPSIPAGRVGIPAGSAVAPALTIQGTAAPTAQAAMPAAAMAEAAAMAAVEVPTDHFSSLHNLDSFQYESRISLELLQKALFPFANSWGDQYR
jgi:hypothetical protein